MGLFEQARSRSRWGAGFACVWASVNGLVNVGMLAQGAFSVHSGSAGPAAPLVVVNNAIWLLANLLILVAAAWGSQGGDDGKRIGIF